jgi:mono/diheme cytochrome c family protein
MTRTHALALVAFVCALALAAAGCGGGEEVAPTPETVEGTVPEGTTETVDLGGGDAAAGKEVYASTGCGSCHTYEPAGSSAEIGPNLDESLQGDDPQAIYTSIVDPDAEITEGFSGDLMPENYGEQLDATQLADLVAFLQPQS